MPLWHICDFSANALPLGYFHSLRLNSSSVVQTCAVFNRYGEHPVCVRCRQGHDLAAESQGVQSRLVVTTHVHQLLV